MSPIYFIAIFILVCVLFSTISDYLERRRRRQLVAELAPRLNSLMERVDSIPADLIAREFREARVHFLNSLVTLKGRGDSAINRCPKCQDTLSVRTTSYYGKIFGCPNYPKCRHLIKVADLNSETLEYLRVE